MNQSANTHTLNATAPVAAIHQVDVASLWDVIGHDWAVKRLQTALSRATLAQSHLFVGAPSIGKSRLAHALARNLLANNSPDPARSARLVDALKHPDLAWVQPDMGSIKVEPIRGLLHTLALSPVEGTHRVAVVERADLMSDAAKNALLKTLEEPNPRVVIVLTAPGVESVPPTIASRCQTLALRLVPEAVIERALAARGGDAATAAHLAHQARGRIGWALSALADGSIAALRDEQLAEFKDALGANRTGRFAFAEKLAREDADLVQTRLEQTMFFWREQLRAGAITPSHARAALLATHAAMQRIERNVNPRMALDVLMLDLP